MEELKTTARESLETLAAIADAAGEKLHANGLKPSDLANPNQMASPNLLTDMQNRNRERARSRPSRWCNFGCGRGPSSGGFGGDV